ncbi:MAG: phosphoribosylaminoimidazolesuccinocarboxamide synthase [Myxococcales bacterium]|nr:phosphoribosylaminoimidazolesuccinocarboxamide synthase [Myxococcales bacterium]
MESLEGVLRSQLAATLDGTNFDSTALGAKYEGKVRDCYVTGDGRRIIVVSDRISAFDVVLGTLPCKGQVLNQIAQYWFEESQHIAPNHMLEVPDPNVMVGRECTPLKAEFVMRSYLTGVTSTSIWRAYEGGARTFCGHDLPEGMSKNQKLTEAILTPSTKADKGDHDVSVSREELIAMGHISAEDFDEAATMVKELFAFGQKRAAERGLILVDTKYEIGVSSDGEMMLIDEIHTPDSSRYWYAGDFEERLARGDEPRSLDKEYLRRWMSETHDYRGDGPPPAMPDDVRVEAAKRYVEIYELITGKTFVPDQSPKPEARISANLGIAS